MPLGALLASMSGLFFCASRIAEIGAFRKHAAWQSVSTLKLYSSAECFDRHTSEALQFKVCAKLTPKELIVGVYGLSRPPPDSIAAALNSFGACGSDAMVKTSIAPALWPISSTCFCHPLSAFTS